MTVEIIDQYISNIEAAQLIDGLSPYLVKSPRPGMSEAQYQDPVRVLYNIYDGRPILEPVENESTNIASSLLTDVVNAVGGKIGEHYGVDAVVSVAIFAEISEGGKNGLHCDAVMLDGTPWEDGDWQEDMEFSALLYLNTSGSDYEGGQISFPNQDLVITPKTGRLIFFPGDIDHPHEVLEVSAGKRYTLVLFYGSRDKVRQYQEFLSSREFGDV